MRPDMGKCVIERPRRGSRTALSAKVRHYGKIVEYDDGPDYDGLTHLPVSRRQEGYNKKLGDKDFTDVLGPLHRYLRSSCGRLWMWRPIRIVELMGMFGSQIDTAFKKSAASTTIST